MDNLLGTFVAHASYEWKALKFGFIGSEITIRCPEYFLPLAVCLSPSSHER